ncbi:hypothetical protein [Thalassolituus sp.]|uniref:hypothetical protein n=1 Tax=Thalassolituus sp. TaxID=2030822 RepID=UPI00262DE1C0|nr:hypothetical protein [Thalassolituus sp.]
MIKGAYQLRVIDAGKCISDTGEVRNLILNEALNHGDPFAAGFICVGDGDSEPYSTQAALDNQLGQVSGTFTGDATIFMDGQDRYARRSVTVSLTGIDGDIREVGFKKISSGDLLSRTLIRDGNGTVTWVPLQSHQTLEVTFFVYFQMPSVLTSGVVNTGIGGSTGYSVKPHADIEFPAGILAGRYSNPLGSLANDAMLMLLDDSNTVSSTLQTVDVDSENSKTKVVINWAATGENRRITGFELSDNEKNGISIELDSIITLPSDADISVELEFEWGIPG